MDTPRFAPANRVKGYFARMEAIDSNTAAAAKTKLENKAASKANVAIVMKVMDWTEEHVVAKYLAENPKGKRAIIELLHEGHGYETAPSKFFAKLAKIDPPTLLFSKSFEEAWKPKQSSPQSAEQPPQEDIEAQLARSILETAIQRGQAKKVRKIIEALVES